MRLRMSKKSSKFAAELVNENENHFYNTTATRGISVALQHTRSAAYHA